MTATKPAAQILPQQKHEIIERARLAADSACDGSGVEPSQIDSDAIFFDLIAAEIQSLAPVAITPEDRNAALEEAAAICDRFSKLYDNPQRGYDNGYTMCAQRAANEIRALKAAVAAPASQHSAETVAMQKAILRNELAIIIGCVDGRTGKQKSDAVMGWIEKYGWPDAVRRVLAPVEHSSPAQACGEHGEAAGRLAANAAQAPQGWKLVPVFASVEALSVIAGDDYLCLSDAKQAKAVAKYDAILAASPEVIALPAAQGAVVEYQFRTQADWHPHWSGWDRCTKEQYEDKLRTPLLHDWHYEVRALCVAAEPVKPVEGE